MGKGKGGSHASTLIITLTHLCSFKLTHPMRTCFFALGVVIGRRLSSDKGGAALAGNLEIEKANEDQGGYQEDSVYGVGLEWGFRDSQ